MAKTEIRLHDYIHSPVHYAVAAADYDRLARLVSSLPRLADPVSVLTESDSLAQERLADHISAVLDRRDVPSGETPLHLAVRLSDLRAARALAGAGADVSLQNVAGWNPLQEAVCSRKSDLALALLRHHHAAAWAKWRRRLPRLVAVLRRMPDFYMEISFHFESSLLPFAKRLAPSDTYRIWKRDADLRADTSLAGFDGLKIQRADQSFLFLGGGEPSLDLPSGSLLVLNRTEKRIFDAFENAGGNLSPADEEGFAAQRSVYRPGMDVTRAELVGRTNWRRQEKTEMVGEWKARVYEIQNVMFSFKSRKAAPQFDYDPEEIKAMPLVFKDSSEDEFLVAETPGFISLEMPRRRNSSFVKADLLKDQKNPSFVNLEAPRRRSSNFERGDLMKDQKNPSFINLEVPRRRNSNFEKEDLAKDQKNPSFINLDLPRRRNSSFEKGDLNLIKDNKKAWIPMDRKSVDLPSAPPQQSFDGRKLGKRTTTDAPPAGKESEYVKSLRPSVWLTEQFPLKTEELLPLLDILANKVKAVRRLRELLTTKFPPGTFPVKVAIPVVPTVKVVVTFTKFVNLEAVEQFYTPMSSPRQFGEEQYPSSSSSSSSSSFSFEADPFVIPRDYTWTSIEDKSEKIKKSKSSKKGKQ